MLHCRADYVTKRDWDDPRYAAEILSHSKKYQGQIRIRTGLEFGMRTRTIPLYETLFSVIPLKNSGPFSQKS